MTVVIPALDEAESIAHVIDAIPRELGAAVVVVDNGSRDATADRARAAGADVLDEPVRGYGRACLRGASHALATGAEAIAFLDADFSDRPEDLQALVALIACGEADLAIGSRLRGKREPGALLWHSALGNALISASLRPLYGLRLTDLGPLRVIRADLFARLDMREMTYGWPVEMLAKAARLGARVVEIPVSYRQRIGSSKISGTLHGTLGATYFLLTRTLAYTRWNAPTP